MLNFIKLEFLKLKRSKLLIFVFLGLFAPPGVMFFGLAFGNAGPMTMKAFLDEIILYGLLLFNVIVYALLAGYLIVREYNDHTVKSMLTTPISRNKFILGKFITFELLVILLTVVVFILSVILGICGGTTDMSFEIIGNGFVHLLVGNILLSITITPFIFISLVFKNVVPTVIGGIIVSFSNLAIMGNSFSPLSPFCTPLIIISNQLGNYSYGTVTPVAIMIITSLIGLILSMIYFNRADVAL